MLQFGCGAGCKTCGRLSIGLGRVSAHRQAGSQRFTTRRRMASCLTPWLRQTDLLPGPSHAAKGTGGALLRSCSGSRRSMPDPIERIAPQTSSDHDGHWRLPRLPARPPRGHSAYSPAQNVAKAGPMTYFASARSISSISILGKNGFCRKPVRGWVGTCGYPLRISART
jgi:hypothetical protein